MVELKGKVLARLYSNFTAMRDRNKHPSPSIGQLYIL